MYKGGFAGNILLVNLTAGTTETRPLDPEAAEKYMGGLGLAIKLAHDHAVPGAEPLAPDNTVVIGTGALVGTNLPSVSRVYGVTKLPTSGSIGWCGAGGVTFGCNLKYAGYDQIVITGRAPSPVRLKITDDGAELVDAAPLWGLGVEETCRAVWNEPGRPAGVLAIGPAGENQVKFSMAFVDRIATLGRGGFGAVLGSKNLKAVTAQGTRGIGVADRWAYQALLKKFLDEIRAYPYLKEWQRLGMIKSFPLIPVDVYEAIKTKRVACVSCPLGCKDMVQIQDGPLQGFAAATSSVVNLWTPVIYGFQDYREAIKLIAGLDQLGLDMFEYFGVLLFARELVRRGLLALEPGEPEIIPGHLGSFEAWAKIIAFRKGTGDLLAGGFAALLEKTGAPGLEAAPALIKNMHPYAGPGAALPWDLFGTMELGQILDPRGPHVGSGGSPTYFAKRPLEVFPKHFERMGIPAAARDRILPGPGPELRVGRLLKYSHNWFTILGSLGICARAQVNRFYNAELCARLYEATTGFSADAAGLLEKADRAWTLLRLANLGEGFDRHTQEKPPQGWFGKNGFKDYVTETPLTDDQVRMMILDYYREWGWDENGRPTPERLRELGIPN
ncbi:MAG: aldehyde ferredoxin oxidoreductase N-terminal domain-containing protein [Pseudomonadota bacterium]